MKHLFALLFLVPSLCFGAVFTAPKDMLNVDEWEIFLSQVDEESTADNTIYWEGNGGYTVIAEATIKLINNLEAAGKKVTLVVTGPAASGHAFVLCGVKHVVGEKYITPILFHAARTDDGKIIVDSTNSVVHACLVKRYLTEEEQDGIINHNKDIIKFLFKDGTLLNETIESHDDRAK